MFNSKNVLSFCSPICLFIGRRRTTLDFTSPIVVFFTHENGFECSSRVANTSCSRLHSHLTNLKLENSSAIFQHKQTHTSVYRRQLKNPKQTEIFSTIFFRFCLIDFLFFFASFTFLYRFFLWHRRRCVVILRWYYWPIVHRTESRYLMAILALVCVFDWHWTEFRLNSGIAKWSLVLPKPFYFTFSTEFNSFPIPSKVIRNVYLHIVGTGISSIALRLFQLRFSFFFTSNLHRSNLWAN